MRRGFCLIMFVLCIISCCQEIYAAYPKEESNYYYPDVEAQNAICIEVKSGRILYYKSPFQKVSIASTTKIMTALVAIENAELNDVYEVSNKAAWTDGSTMGLKKGEKLQLYELLYGLMLKSGNDAAVTIAEGIKGSVDEFSILMNQKALDLGMNNSHFVSPHGLDSQEHYSTAFDMSQLSKYALENKEFSKIVKTKSINIKTRNLVNTNPFLEVYEGVDGIKTGYTGQAGRCLVISAVRGDMRIITVILNCSSNKTRIESGRKIMNYVFSNFKNYRLAAKDSVWAQIPVLKGKDNFVNGRIAEDLVLPMSSKELETIVKSVSIKEILKAPINARDDVGEAKFSLSGDFEKTIKIFSGESVLERKIVDYFLEIFTMWLKDLVA